MDTDGSIRHDKRPTIRLHIHCLWTIPRNIIGAQQLNAAVNKEHVAATVAGMADRKVPTAGLGTALIPGGPPRPIESAGAEHVELTVVIGHQRNLLGIADLSQSLDCLIEGNISEID